MISAASRCARHRDAFADVVIRAIASTFPCSATIGAQTSLGLGGGFVTNVEPTVRRVGSASGPPLGAALPRRSRAGSPIPCAKRYVRGRHTTFNHKSPQGGEDAGTGGARVMDAPAGPPSPTVLHDRTARANADGFCLAEAPQPTVLFGPLRPYPATSVRMPRRTIPRRTTPRSLGDRYNGERRPVPSWPGRGSIA